LNTDLLKLRHRYLYRNMMVKLNVNEIRSVIKMGNFSKRRWVERVAQEVCSEMFI
jgi:hypothetical protein